MSRLTDYGIMLLAQIARHPGRPARSARELAGATLLPNPTASKILKRLARQGLLNARRGAKGGFGLARPPSRITMAEIVTALEGRPAVTICSARGGRCGRERICGARSHLMKVNRLVFRALEGITLADIAREGT